MKHEKIETFQGMDIRKEKKYNDILLNIYDMKNKNR